MRFKFKVRRQPPLKGRRMPTYSGLPPAVRRWLESVAAKSHCTVPMVVTTVLADKAGIDLTQRERYDELPEHVEKRRAS